MSALTLLVIGDPFSAHIQSLRLPEDVRAMVSLDPEKLAAAAPEADAILFATGNPKLLTAILPRATRVRWIHSMWTGVEGLLSEQMLAHPAPLSNGRGVFRWPLADWVTAAMLYFAFDVGRVVRQQQAGVWEPFVSGRLEGKTLGIIGYGSIGSAAAARAKVFEMRVLAMRRKAVTADALVDKNYVPAQLNEMVAASDYILAALPATPETRGLIGAAQIAAMKPSAVFLNVGRGTSVDEPALIEALQKGRIRGAALDVFAVEPLPAGHPFYTMPNVLMSPHTADRVEGFLEPAMAAFLENLQRFLAGQPLQNLVDKHAGY